MFLYSQYLGNMTLSNGGISITESQQATRTTFVNDSSYIVPTGLNFLEASDKVVPGVVHIQSSHNIFGNFGRMDNFPSSGSGVILTDNGYITTNYHVIEEASNIVVVLNDNRRFNAKVVGFDETTDLALIKIDAAGLPYVVYGNSDLVRPGEWVLAVGNPFNLNSTVTAGIISAKARNMDILQGQLRIESFLQTDAAVNPGNSGGALVNLRGELIGINTAIATGSGSYEGYSFAVPVSLVQKVMDDLLEYGKVQRGLLGITIDNNNAEIAEILKTNHITGVFVISVQPNSAADEAGMRKGDIILKVQGREVKNVSELQEMVARNRPGDPVKVTFARGSATHEITAILKDVDGNPEVSYMTYENEVQGAVFENISEKIKSDYNIKHGALIKELGDGKWKDAGITEGFIITNIDKAPIEDYSEIIIMMEFKRGGVLVEGIDSNGENKLFAVEW